MPYCLNLLGNVSFVCDGIEERLAVGRPTSLLVHLAVRGEWVGRRELALLYRPDAPEDAALTYLRKLIFRARGFPWARDLEVEIDALRWRVKTDVATFSAALKAQDWSAAISAYRGPLLGGVLLTDAPGYLAWQELESAALEAAWLRAANSRARELEQAGQFVEAANVQRLVLAHDPFAEDSVQTAMRLLEAAGLRGEAIAVYESFKKTLQEEFGTIPLETTEALADSLRATEIAPPAPEPRATRLPVPGTPFVGRRAELAQLERLLFAEDERLVTLVGLGGSGKTRLAIELSQRAGRAGIDAAFVSLTTTTLAAGVAAVVMTLIETLGLEAPDQNPERALIAGLRGRELLLVLDSFETVIDAAPLVGRLIEGAPHLKVLVTSREALRIHGECLVDLGGLETPPEAGEPDDSDFDAVRLFVQQATRIFPAFAPGDAALRSIGQLCRRLDGLPLAIELAASWSRVLSPQELLTRLEQDLDLLSSNRRDIAARHQSLWRVFDHTWERLADEERRSLPLLTTFSGGFGLEAAKEVAGADLRVLLRLLEHQLVRRTAEGRFALHELVRQYALQRVTDQGALARAKRAHSRYYCRLLARLTPDLKGDDVQGGLSRVQYELANIVLAWDEAIDNADVQALESARDALDYFLYYRARFATAVDMFGRAAAAIDPQGSENGGTEVHDSKALANDASTGHDNRQRTAGRLLLLQADHERHRGNVALSQRLATKSLERLASAADEIGVAYARLALGNGELRLGHYRQATSYFEAVLTVALAAGDCYLEGAAHNGLANLISYTEGDIAAAEEHYRASLRAHKRLGNLEGINGALINLGACRYDVHDFAAAAEYWQEATALATLLGYKQREAVLHNNLGSLCEATGELTDAQDRYERSLALRRQIGDASGEANVLHNMGRLASARGELDEARRRIQASLELYLELDEKAGVAHVRSSLARVLSALGRDAEADRQVGEALALALEIDSRVDILGSLLTVAMLRVRSGQDADAASLAQTVALAAAGSSEPLRAKAEAIVRRAGANLTGTATQAVGSHLLSVARRELAILRGDSARR